jgi:hypothetical protein
MDTVKNTGKIRLFWIVYIIYTAILIFCIAAALIVFYKYIEAYEMSQPEHKVEDYIAGIDKNLLIDLITDSYTDSITKYEDIGDVSEYIFNSLDISDLRYVKNISKSKQEKPVFTIAAGDVYLINIELTQSGKGDFNFPGWNISDASLLRENIISDIISLNMTVPDGAIVYVNGIEADKSCCIGKTEYDKISEFESSDVSRPLCTAWNISGLYLQPDIRVELGEYILENETRENGIIYDFPAQMKHSYEISVPSGSSVTVNGVMVSDDYIKHSAPYEYSELESGLQNLPYNVTYQIDGLLSKPAISVNYRGNELINKSNFIYDYPESMKYGVSIEVPKGARVYVNGIEPADKYIAKDNKTYDIIDFSGYKKYIAAFPVMTEYYIDGLYVKPEICVEFGKESLEIYDYTENNNKLSYKFNYNPSDECKADYSSHALHFAEDYIHYITCGSSGTEKNVSEVLSHMISGTESYNRIILSESSVRYITPYAAVVYNSVDADNFVKYSEECFSCRVVFDVSLKNYGVSKKYAGMYDLLFIIIDNIPYVADMLITGDM